MPLPQDPLLGPSTLNVGLIEGGVAPNVLAPEASAQILIRTVEPTDPLKAAIRALAAPGVTVAFPVELPSHKAGARAGRLGHDRRELRQRPPVPRRAGARATSSGPGTIRVAHTAQEHIRKADLLRGVELYVRLATDLLAREAP